MSEVNADGVLLNPHEALLQEVQALTNSLTAEEPEGMEDDKAPHRLRRQRRARRGGGRRSAHTRVGGPGRPGPQGGGHRQLRGGAPAHPGQEGRPGGQNEETKAVSPTEGGGGTGTTQTDD